MNLDRLLDVFGSKDGGKYRNDDAVMQAVAEAFAEAEPPPPPPPTVLTVERVDELVAPGTWRTSFQCVDRRLTKGKRIFKTFPVPVEPVWLPVLGEDVRVLPKAPIHTALAIEETRNAAQAAVAVRAPIGGGAYVYQAVDTDEYWHDTDAEEMGNLHLYGVISGGALTPDASDMTVDLAAGNDLFNGASVTVPAAANGYTLVADGSNERWAALCTGSAGTPVLVSGDAAASASVEPTKPEIGERVLHGMYKIQAGQTIAANCEYQLDKRVMTHGTYTNIVQRFVEGGVHKSFFALGGAPAFASVTTGSSVGIGLQAVVDATSASLSTVAGTNRGSWNHSTGATNAEDSGFIGPYRAYTDDWTLVWRGVIPSAASQSIVIGVKANTQFADENNLIGFRVTDTGNIFGVCDSGGTETTRDAGATGATECTLRIEVRSAGTIVRFYRNDVQVGADVTTNIPTGNLYTACGIQNSTTADKDMYTYDLYGWCEV